ncbi:MAG: Hypothetical protein BHV28_07590 [Candidatus Tokpelaia hoelldobleri]|uniref:Phosphatidate cytidyltransferase n=1 Tax=Candidatus Tokpelaia hoelldobleri TaxID=1902579 RepID=A0A1U9JUB6_9HYPH|nr:MAG: Hypothetical protein BHV28_07590 [Candidatus Tokpelaia hoelldoblerii]
MQEAGSGAAGTVLTGRTAVIAGNGRLPVAVANALRDTGQNPFLVLLRGEADKQLYDFEHCEISVVEFARLIESMQKAGVRNVVLAGGIVSRPHWRDLRFDIPTLKALPRLFRALGRGDDALLRAFIGLVESYGFRVVGAHQVVPVLLAPRGVRLTRKKAGKTEERNIEQATEAARQLGVLDVGQGAVAVGGRVVALEGAEGTDNMLKRVAEMRQERRIPREGGVLVKTMKPTQDKRADLPAIGPQTVKNAHQAGLYGIVVEADRSFILEFEKTMELADHYGMFIESR